jgi:hypothetical protein
VNVHARVKQLVNASVILAGLFGCVPRAGAEPMFLSRQYTRCTQCHYSETGGGLLTAYGRALSGQELSTTGRTVSTAAEQEQPQGEEAFLWGTVKRIPKGLELGVELRPAHLAYAVSGFDTSRNIWMNADAIAAYQSHGWTAYGEIGRQPTTSGWTIGSYEHWVGYKKDSGLGVRAGRFLPSYGVAFADHTSLNRSTLGLAEYDQVYGVEVSRTTEHSLLQGSVSPGRAQSIVDDDGRQAFTATGRWQIDLGPRSALVASGMYRDASTLDVRSGAGGVAFGLAPTGRISTWTQLDIQRREGGVENTYIVVNETAVEAVRGVWVKVSPQLRTDTRAGIGGLRRLALSLDLLPRTHWNVNVNYYRDHSTPSDIGSTIFLTQLHLYL